MKKYNSGVHKGEVFKVLTPLEMTSISKLKKMNTCLKSLTLTSLLSPYSTFPMAIFSIHYEKHIIKNIIALRVIYMRVLFLIKIMIIIIKLKIRSYLSVIYPPSKFLKEFLFFIFNLKFYKTPFLKVLYGQ